MVGWLCCEASILKAEAFSLGAGKLSPDGYIQMALQLAYRRLHGKGTPTYETASTRLFLHGRTDTIRTYSADSQKFTEAVVAGEQTVCNSLLISVVMISILH
jgi:hypothetical protein